MSGSHGQGLVFKGRARLINVNNRGIFSGGDIVMPSHIKLHKICNLWTTQTARMISESMSRAGEPGVSSLSLLSLDGIAIRWEAVERM